MSFTLINKGICAKMKRFSICSLIIIGVIVTLIRWNFVYLPASENKNNQKHHAVSNSKVSEHLPQQVNPNNLEILMDLLKKAKQIERQKVQQVQSNRDPMPKFDQISQLHRQVLKPLESNYFNEHDSAQTADTPENKLFHFRKDRKQEPDMNYLSIQTKPHGGLQVLEHDKNFPRHSTLNVYHISKPKSNDTSGCIRTTTKTRFIICTYGKSEDIYVSGDIQKYGRWEDTITNFIFGVLKQNKPITFLDIGANIGYFSLLAASTGQSVISVEPWRLNLQKLGSSIIANQFQKYITVLNNAVSNERRTVIIDVGIHNNKGAARLVSDSEHLNIKETIKVKSILLNDLADIIYTPYVVLKLDIEGHECRVLEKSDDIFDRFKVLLITMEWSGMQNLKNQPGVACPEQNIQQMVNMLTRRGFVPYSFKDYQQLNPKYTDKWNIIDIYWTPVI